MLDVAVTSVSIVVGTLQLSFDKMLMVDHDSPDRAASAGRGQLSICIAYAAVQVMTISLRTAPDIPSHVTRMYCMRAKISAGGTDVAHCRLQTVCSSLPCHARHF